MKNTSKALVIATLATLISACQLSTAPKNSTYWAKKGTVYQTHKMRIIGHDAEIDCRHNDASSNLDKAGKFKFFEECMYAKDYVKYDNFYKIKEVKADR